MQRVFAELALPRCACILLGSLLTIVVSAATQPLHAQGLDQLYEKPSTERTWGEAAADRVGYDGFTKSYALVVGISRYENGLDPLPTKQDPIRVRDFLINEAGFDYVHVLTDEKVTYRRVRQLMVNVFPRLIDGNDRFFFYWSGHGTQQANRRGGQAGYLPLMDSAPDDFASMVSMQDIGRWDNLIDSRHALYFLDACLSGLAGTASMSERRRVRLDELVKPAHHLVTAGTSEEKTIAGGRWGGSVFTNAFLRAARGAADTDSLDFPRDGVVSLFELIKYVRDYVPREAEIAGWEKSITPQLRDLGGSDGEFFFLANRDATIEPAAGSEGVGVTSKGSSSSMPLSPLSTFSDCEYCPEMVVLPSGKYLMGSPREQAGHKPNETPQHEVTISKPFAMGRYEVTRAQYAAFVAERPRQRQGCLVRSDASVILGRNNAWNDPGFEQSDDHPVVCVSWEDAQDYVAWLNEKYGPGYHLPSEAEWEYAARGDSDDRFWWGASERSACLNANIYDRSGKTRHDLPWESIECDDGFAETARVGQFGANAFSLRDMAGNVFEWIEDQYFDDYSEAPSDGRARIDGRYSRRVIRGGSWYNAIDLARSASRSRLEAGSRNFHIGFRVAKTLKP